LGSETRLWFCGLEIVSTIILPVPDAQEYFGILLYKRTFSWVLALFGVIEVRNDLCPRRCTSDIFILLG
jgi:hypothetical protein